jgi:2-polyprenyl-6-methoxyphenol hydroxylase-like FAD-dependent oxidoreductase
MIRTGYDTLIFPRPEFYQILLKRIPAHKISFKKKITMVEEKDDKIYVHCSDNTTHEADIVIGADGAYSGVRQSIYKQMSDKGILPKADQEDFRIGNTSVVGVAKGLDPQKYPSLNDRYSHFNTVVYNDNRMVSFTRDEILYYFILMTLTITVNNSVSYLRLPSIKYVGQ